jgi:hypothetical protein
MSASSTHRPRGRRLIDQAAGNSVRNRDWPDRRRATDGAASISGGRSGATHASFSLSGCKIASLKSTSKMEVAYQSQTTSSRISRSGRRATLAQIAQSSPVPRSSLMQKLRWIKPPVDHKRQSVSLPLQRCARASSIGGRGNIDAAARCRAGSRDSRRNRGSSFPPARSSSSKAQLTGGRHRTLN